MALSATKNMSVCPTSSEPAAVVCGVTLQQAKVKLQQINSCHYVTTSHNKTTGA